MYIYTYVQLTKHLNILIFFIEGLQYIVILPIFQKKKKKTEEKI